MRRSKLAVTDLGRDHRAYELGDHTATLDRSVVVTWHYTIRGKDGRLLQSGQFPEFDRARQSVIRTLRGLARDAEGAR